MTIDSSKPFRDYLTEYQEEEKNEKIDEIVELLGVDKAKLVELLKANVTESNLNEYNRFNNLKDSVDKEKARDHFEAEEGGKLPPFKINIRTEQLLKEFVLNGSA